MIVFSILFLSGRLRNIIVLSIILLLGSWVGRHYDILNVFV